MSAILSKTISILGGSLQVTVLVAALGGAAAVLDWLVRWMRRSGFSHALCTLMHYATLSIAFLDLALIVAYAAAHVWEARPEWVIEPPVRSVTLKSFAGRYL